MFPSVKNYCLGLFLVLAAQTGYAGHGPASDVAVQETKIGAGIEAESFSVVDVHYTGKLEDGTIFDSSAGREGPFRFTLGAGMVIPGWDMGIKGMKPGGKRVLTIPPELAYGKKGAGSVIPPNATLIFDVELIAVTPPPFVSIGNSELASKLKNGVKLIDIRRAEEWKQTGVVDGSIKLTAFDGRGRFIKSFVDMLAKSVQPDEEFILICRTGNRTATLSNWLSTEGGYKNVVNVKDGIVSWIKEGQSVNKSGS